MKGVQYVAYTEKLYKNAHTILIKNLKEKDQLGGPRAI
jgi:hypothetical protein